MSLLAAAASVTFACVSPTHHDGDAIRCAGDRRSMRLYGIDAPEMPGACRPGRRCTPGDPYASRDHLAALTKGHAIMCSKLATDVYGRSVVRCSADGADLSCAMVADGFAVERYCRLGCGNPQAPHAVDKSVSPGRWSPSTWWLLLVYIPIMNALTYRAFADDKQRAQRGQRRLSEAHLLRLSAFGGAPAGIVAQQRLRHKTRKQPFASYLIVILGLQIGVVCGAIVIAVLP